MSMYIDGVRYRSDIKMPTTRGDIPLPPEAIKILERRKTRKHGSGRPMKYNVSKMKVGESFLYDGNKKNAQGHCGYFNLTTSYKFVAGKIKDEVRVWRVA